MKQKVNESNHPAGFPLGFPERHAAVFFDKVNSGWITDVADGLLGSKGGEDVRRRFWSVVRETLKGFNSYRTLHRDPSGGGDAGCYAFSDPVEALCFADVLHSRMSFMNVRSLDDRLDHHVRIGIVMADITTDRSYSSYLRDAARLEAASSPGCTLVTKSFLQELNAKAWDGFLVEEPVLVVDKTGRKINAFKRTSDSTPAREPNETEAHWKYRVADHLGLRELARELYDRYLWEEDARNQ